MTYEEYGVWLERHVADCSDGEGRSMLKMCLARWLDTHSLPEKKRVVTCPYCQKVVGEYISCINENMGRCQGYVPKGNPVKDVAPKRCFSCYWNNTSSEDCTGCIGFGNWRKGDK